MSKYLTFPEMTFANLDLLLAALKQLGYEYESGTNLRLNGWGSQRRTADVVIRKDVIGATYGDVGFQKTPDGYIAIMDDIDVRYIRNGNFLVDLKVEYGEQFSAQLATNVHGTTMRRVEGKKIKITVRA